MGIKLVYFEVQPAAPPEPSTVLYIDPGWPLTDGRVEIPGYDVPALPASGVAPSRNLLDYRLGTRRGTVIGRRYSRVTPSASRIIAHEPLQCHFFARGCQLRVVINPILIREHAP